MSRQAKNGIIVEKTLHLENAFVHAIGYTSLDSPVLREMVSTGGKTLVRTSEDNGRNWTTIGEWESERRVGDRIACNQHPVWFLDEEHGILIEFVTEYEKAAEEKMTFGPTDTGDMLELRTGRIFYRFSKDAGKTWSPRKQLIQKGSGYDEVHWAEGIYHEKNACNFTEIQRATKLQDGAIIVPVWFWQLGEDGELDKRVDRFGEVIWPLSGAACFRGVWREDLSDLDWEMSNPASVPEYMSRGLDEAEVAEMAGGRLMMVIRGASGARQTMSGAKFFSISKDGGITWGPAVPLTYPDGSLVHSPASFPNFFRSAKNGRVYLIANVLPEPAHHSDPRYPLKIVEIDREYLWALPETETVIADRQAHHPRFVRFSNWQRIEDRETGNPVIYMTEARIDAIIPDTPGKIDPHAYRYEIKLPE